MKYSESFEETPLLVAIITYISYGILIIFGYIRELLRKCNLEKAPVASEYLTEVSLQLMITLHCLCKLLCVLQNIPASAK